MTRLIKIWNLLKSLEKYQAEQELLANESEGNYVDNFFSMIDESNRLLNKRERDGNTTNKNADG